MLRSGVTVRAAAPETCVVLAAGRAVAACLVGSGPVLAGPGPAGGQGGDRRGGGVGAARNARESLRWNLRAKAERAVPRPDGAVLDSLEELSARTRAVARSLPDIRAVDGPSQDRASFGTDYAALLRDLAGPVRQLADLRSSPSRAALTGASDCQHQLERETAQLPDHSAVRSAAQHLARLTSEIISEVAEHQAAPDAPAAHRDKSPEPGLAANDPPPTTSAFYLPASRCDA
jgi:hypothetical protein